MNSTNVTKNPAGVTGHAGIAGTNMTWNEPPAGQGRGNGRGGGPGNGPGSGPGKDPWGGNKQDGPPDLDEVVKKMQEKFGGLFGGKRGGGRGKRGGASGVPGGGMYVLAVVIIGALWLAYDMTYTIQQAERGVVLRFGKYVETIQPGLNFRLPRPIERVYKIDVKKIYNFTDKASMLTRDENLVEVEFFIQYQIQRPEQFLFEIRWPNRNADSVLRSIMESSVRDVVGKSNMDFVLTEGRENIASQTRELMQRILNDYETGLLISELKLRDARPPEAVKAAFDDAIKAREDQERAKNEAEAYRNDIVPKARGRAAREVTNAEAYKARVTDQAKGDASRFEQLLAEYEKAPAVTRDRLYLETVEQVLANNRKIMIDVESGNNLMYLPLDRIATQAAGAVIPRSDSSRDQPGAGSTDVDSPFQNNRTGARR